MNLIPVLIFTYLIMHGNSCKMNSSCETCTDSKCTFVVSMMHKHYCVADVNLVQDIRITVSTARGCRGANKIIKRKYLNNLNISLYFKQAIVIKNMIF